jgi:SAM-dependent methyltransferase
LRSNLLRWFEFKKDSKVLEIGAGCGAITEELVRNEVGVTALEPSHKKTLINAHRNHSAKNLSLVGGSLAGYKPSQKFDYIVCVGGLGYVQSFFDSQTPYHDVLSAIKNSLANGGKLLLAIDNRLGFKYWAGAREDHTGRFFEGHNGYPSNTGMETFGKKELTNLVLSAGFSETRFFYPYPDYKTPFFVYSDDFYPGDGAAFPLGRLPTPVFDKTREQLFSEQNAMRFIEKNDLYRNFSNSFLVEAS